MSIAPEIASQDLLATDSRSLASIWHSSAPRDVAKAFRAGRNSAGWKAWQKHLRRRKRPVDLDQLLAGADRALLWGLDRPAAAALFPPKSPAADAHQTVKAVRRWLRDADAARCGQDYALSALDWARRLPQLAGVLPAGAWWKLLVHLLRTAADAHRASADDLLVHQLMAGELAVTLAYLFPEIRACQALMRPGRRALSAGLAQLLDSLGFPHARHFERMPVLLACWTRCRAMGDRLKRACWNDRAEKRYRRLLRNALKLARRDGSHVFTDATAEGHGAALLTAAVNLVGGPRERGLAAARLDVGAKKGPSRPATRLPSATLHSERAAVAVLCADATRWSPRLTVFYPDKSCRVELACGKDLLWSGVWGLDVRINGTRATPTSPWNELCWVSDDDVDYLELGIALGEGVRAERHLLLARKDRILWMADAIFASQPAKIDYRGTLPLAANVTFRQACETREGLLIGSKPRATVVPLALPEWLADRSVGELAATSNSLELRQTVEARAMLAPLFLQIDRDQADKRLTWRQLTIGQSWAVQPSDEAAGYRVAIGRRQWLIYRSLQASARPRSLLGHHLRGEMLVARFHRKRELEPLLEIEQSEESLGTNG
jgi:hypothetical protein